MEATIRTAVTIRIRVWSSLGRVSWGIGPNGDFETRLVTQVEAVISPATAGGATNVPTGSMPLIADRPRPPDDDDVQDTVRGSDARKPAEFACQR